MEGWLLWVSEEKAIWELVISKGDLSEIFMAAYARNDLWGSAGWDLQDIPQRIWDCLEAVSL